MRAVTVLAIAGVLVGAYLGGKMSSTGTVEYEYAEVYNAVGQCEEGSFMGGCSDCKECKSYEYNGGGCSYFKDTLCVLCEPIKHCSTIESESGKLIPAITCTSAYDQVCSKCDNGYWDQDCKPCKVCAEGEYETKQCTHDSNTECAPCTQCTNKEYVAKACSYTSDTECKTCTICTPGDFSAEICFHGQKYEFPENVYTVTPDTVCQKCTEPADDMYVTDVCTITKDTEFAWCNRCGTGSTAAGDEPAYEEGTMYIDDQCEAGTWDTVGEKIECAPCKTRPTGSYTVWHCDSTDVHDSLHASCSECQDGEYLFAECTDSADTVCPKCTAVENCKPETVTCTDATDSLCGECREGFFGETCCYEKQFSACGSMTTRERRAEQYGYEGESTEDFIQFCLEMCDEFPDCMAFEIEDGGDGYTESGDEVRGGRGDRCFFKSAFTQLTDDYTQDCYSNICRQGENFKDFKQYEDDNLVAQAHALFTSHKGDRDSGAVGANGADRFGR